MKICKGLQFELQNLTKKLVKLCKTSYENLQLQNPSREQTSFANFIFINMKVVGKAKVCYACSFAKFD